ncbi:hypothetical protein LZ31DRAFT_294159 [Colletotrichum somersetense]|nr:hypothetical protein LZ31DRAFT_294159 [Colletotrichum somersetense]
MRDERRAGCPFIRGIQASRTGILMQSGQDREGPPKCRNASRFEATRVAVTGRFPKQNEGSPHHVGSTNRRTVQYPPNGQGLQRGFVNSPPAALLSSPSGSQTVLSLLFLLFFFLSALCNRTHRPPESLTNVCSARTSTTALSGSPARSFHLCTPSPSPQTTLLSCIQIPRTKGGGVWPAVPNLPTCKPEARVKHTDIHPTLVLHLVLAFQTSQRPHIYQA